ncbi:MAG TPA: pyridoxal-phosphate dependent enzyme, partial [Archangium sp.]|nr:pyridoxal-phosphate dependent enzyme [Archangium sp.]
MVTLQQIEDAQQRIGEAVYRSPCPKSEQFKELTDCATLNCKLENLQRTGAFKERGALNKLLTLSADERNRGVIAASAGNHAQGLA